MGTVVPTKQSAVEHFQQTNSSPTRGAWITFAANLNDIGDEHRATARINERLIVLAGLVAVIASAALLALPLVPIAPLCMGIGAFMAYVIYARESNLAQATECERGAAMALAKASLTPTWRGCGMLTALFRMLFSSNDEVLRFGDKRIGGSKA